MRVASHSDGDAWPAALHFRFQNRNAPPQTCLSRSGSLPLLLSLRDLNAEVAHSLLYDLQFPPRLLRCHASHTELLTLSIRSILQPALRLLGAVVRQLHLLLCGFRTTRQLQRHAVLSAVDRSSEAEVAGLESSKVRKFGRPREFAARAPPGLDGMLPLPWQPLSLTRDAPWTPQPALPAAELPQWRAFLALKAAAFERKEPAGPTFSSLGFCQRHRAPDDILGLVFGDADQLRNFVLLVPFPLLARLRMQFASG
eukprot:SAG31_NODE_120_length_23892_cov_10.545623_19_plen_255_part_00